MNTHTEFSEGTYYQLPEGMTWEGIAASRRKWGIDRSMAPLAVAPGVCAWGRLLPSSYRRA